MGGIKFGVVGLGRIGQAHCRHFTESKGNYELVALCDVEPERIRRLADQYGCAGYIAYEEFLNNPEMELAIISTRSLEHARHAEQALTAGKTVLLEKPIGVTAVDYRLLQQLVQEYPDKLYFLHNHRFEPAFTNARTIISEGLLGTINIVKLCKHHPFMRRNDWQMRLDCGGGQLSVWGPHLIDQGVQLLGAPVRDVWSYLRRILTPGDGDDHVRITLQGENDVVVEIEISNSVAIPSPYCTVYGSRGALWYDQAQTRLHLRYLDPEFHWPDAVAEAGNPAALCADPDLPWVEETRKVEPDTNMWDYVEVAMAKHLYDALRNGIPFPVTSADALEVVRITEIVKEQNPQFDWIG